MDKLLRVLLPQIGALSLIGRFTILIGALIKRMLARKYSAICYVESVFVADTLLTSRRVYERNVSFLSGIRGEEAGCVRTISRETRRKRVFAEEKFEEKGRERKKE